MILDWKNDSATAVNYDVIDADTGESHPNMDVFYADDEAGLIRYYKRDENGEFYFEASDGTRVTPAWTRANPGHQAWVGPGPEGERKEYADADVQVARAEERANIRIVGVQFSGLTGQNLDGTQTRIDSSSALASATQNPSVTLPCGDRSISPATSFQ